MAQFHLHAADLQQRKQLFKEWFDVEGMWNPTNLADRIGAARDDLGGARSGMEKSLEELQLERSRLNSEGADASSGLLSAVIEELDELILDVSGFYARMDATGVNLYKSEAIKPIFQRLQDAMEELEPNTFDELEREIKRLVEEHQDELAQMGRSYMAQREEWGSTANLQEAAGLIQSHCAEMELETGWVGILDDAINSIMGLPEDPAQDPTL